MQGKIRAQKVIFGEENSPASPAEDKTCDLSIMSWVFCRLNYPDPIISNYGVQSFVFMACKAETSLLSNPHYVKGKELDSVLDLRMMTVQHSMGLFQRQWSEGNRKPDEKKRKV